MRGTAHSSAGALWVLAAVSSLRAMGSGGGSRPQGLATLPRSRFPSRTSLPGSLARCKTQLLKDILQHNVELGSVPRSCQLVGGVTGPRFKSQGVPLRGNKLHVTSGEHSVCQADSPLPMWGFTLAEEEEIRKRKRKNHCVISLGL